MTLLDLLDAPQKRPSLNERVASFLKARPNQWVNYHAFDYAGFGGWRSRIADCRRLYGMTIENKQTRLPDGRKESWYRYVTEAL